MSGPEDLLELRVGAAGHGGVCAARADDGRVVLVRHALPGELVRVRLTEERASYARGDAVEVLEPAPGRVQPPCPFAGPGRCGGCDWQHADLDLQRRLKADVVADHLRRLAGIDREVVVEPLPGDGPDDPEDRRGLGWRTRVRFAVDRDGSPGFHRHRSHDLEPVDTCLIAHPLVGDLGVGERRFPGAGEVAVAVGARTGDRVVDVRGRDARRRPHVPWLGAPTGVRVDGQPLGGRRTVREEVAGAALRVSGTGFWQVHHAAAEALVGAVLEVLRPRPGERALDLYAGAGLFAHALLAAGAGEVVAVEGDATAADDARANTAGRACRVLTGDVERHLAGVEVPARADLVVADPPRAGLGAAVVGAVAARGPRAVAYVSCEPSTLARDLAAFAAAGYRLAGLRAFDAFPMTAHVECVAALEPA